MVIIPVECGQSFGEKVNGLSMFNCNSLNSMSIEEPLHDWQIVEVLDQRPQC